MSNRNTMPRRQFLKSLAAGSAALAGMPVTAQVPTVSGNLAAQIICSRTPQLPCLDGKTYRVCEIFLRGGLACFETLWVTNESADFAVSSDYLDYLQAQDWSLLTDRPVSSTYLPASPGLLHLGGCAEPLFASRLARPKIRVIAVSHDLMPHEAAGPYALTGTRLGRPNLSGMAAAFNRFRAVDDATPRSIIFHSSSDDWIPYAAATGLHGAEFVPLVVRLGDDSFIDSLNRTGLGLTAGDDLLQLYRDRYEAGLTFEAPDPIRSKSFSAYSAAQRYVRDADALLPLLSGLDLTVPDIATTLHSESANQKIVRAALEAVSSTRDDGVEPLPYALAVADSNAKGKLFDSHNRFVDSAQDHTHSQHFALWQIFEVLRDALDSEAWDPSETLVYINTEFGRRQQDGGQGTEHHPHGYVNVLIGGPVQSDAYVGQIDMTTAPGVADGSYTTTDVRAAVALAARIAPYQDSMYGTEAEFSGHALQDPDIDVRYDVLVDDLLGASS